MLEKSIIFTLVLMHKINHDTYLLSYCAHCPLQNLLLERENQYKDHKTYKESYEELQRWLTRAQEKVPQLKQRPLGDKSPAESFAAPLDALLNKQAQGEVLLDNLEHSADVILPSTSPEGQEVIKNDIRAVRESFERLFRGMQNKMDILN